jgi:hypothetical protein
MNGAYWQTSEIREDDVPVVHFARGLAGERIKALQCLANRPIAEGDVD